jgi:hypothetical protein
MKLDFVRAWAGDPKEAAIAAGYSEKTAVQAASKLLKDPAVLRALQEKQAAIIFASGTNMAEVLAEHGATPRKIIMSLVEVIDARPHSKRGYADRIDACKLLTQLYGVLSKATTVLGVERGISPMGVPFEAAWVAQRAHLAQQSRMLGGNREGEIQRPAPSF